MNSENKRLISEIKDKLKRLIPAVAKEYDEKLSDVLKEEQELIYREENAEYRKYGLTLYPGDSFDVRLNEKLSKLLFSIDERLSKPENVKKYGDEMLKKISYLKKNLANRATSINWYEMISYIKLLSGFICEFSKEFDKIDSVYFEQIIKEILEYLNIIGSECSLYLSGSYLNESSYNGELLKSFDIDNRICERLISELEQQIEMNSNDKVLSKYYEIKYSNVDLERNLYLLKLSSLDFKSDKKIK